jgi:hypothetical protein
VTAPDDAQQLDIADVAAEMNADPLSKALFELAQCKVMIRKQSAQMQLLRGRIDELERQRTDGEIAKREDERG